MSTLFNKIEEVISHSCSIKFETFMFQVKITISKEPIDAPIITKTSMLPLSDHFYESTLVDAIDFMLKYIIEQVG